MKKSSIITYSLSLLGLCAVLTVVFLASAVIAQGCSYGDAYCYGNTPAYSYSNLYQYPPSYSPVSPLVATCYSSPISTYVGNAVQWNSSVTGGTGSYNITWIGDENLTGYGSSVSKAYYSAGLKTASIRVISSGQSISVNCSNSVNVMASNNSTYYPYNYNNYNTNYNNNYNSNYYQPIYASCVANTTYANVGTIVGWTATVTGGTGYYTYTWSGTDGLYGSSQYTSFTYNTPGTKTAYVNVYSNGQTATAYCSNSVNVTNSYYGNYGYNNYSYNNYGYSGYAPVAVNTNSNALDVGCYADPATISVNQPVTWSAEASGGMAPYTYSWTGSDGLTGTQNSSIKYYSTSGQKNAIVSVTSADGKTGTRSCSNTVTVRGTGSTYTAPVNTNTGTGANVGTNVQNQNQNNGGQLSGSAIFSFDNVPWGWIAILIILVMFGTVMYLLFNRQKI